MLEKISQIKRSNFVKNVTIVASGTAFAQLVAMLSTPIIARLYGPENMGILGVFVAMAAIVTKISALTYPVAIVLPNRDDDARSLVYASIYISLIFASLTTFIIYFFNDAIINIFNLGDITSFLFFIPIIIVFSALLQVAQQWLIRKQLFKLTAKSVIYKTVIVNSSKIVLGLINPIAFILVLLTSIGYLLHTLLIIINLKLDDKVKGLLNGVNHKNMISLLKSYRDFPLYRAPQELVNGIASSLPILMLSIFFGPAFAGFYTISRTVLKMPTELLGKSIGDVFYPRITQAANNGENIAKLLVKATTALAVVGIVPFSIIILFGPWIFELVFGSDWGQAGEYARWLSIWLFFGFINRPSVKSIPVLKLQGSFLIYEILSTAIRAGALFIGFLLYNDDLLAIILMSVFAALLNLFLIVFTYHQARKYDQNNLELHNSTKQ
ncbi:lipopolysaccharide biosynthesis protein [Alkalihalophilus marmarensis]|uniref:lipopolysaccharide biosynthesis protein n=1 Tax=Alkalihalophilus marmarensis TaxID=521377 RepID=UPI002DB5E932|nr:oligosaccharide flippase family protein [Alkalihalophilus marmarensis]MEC2073409.1 oligosaccharide flippase family protein [Alkalihalophilus marmarensis]